MSIAVTVQATICSYLTRSSSGIEVPTTSGMSPVFTWKLPSPEHREKNARVGM
jgi:hypothetical protein